MADFEPKFSEDLIRSVALLGIPYDKNASFLRGAAAAPMKIRQALHSESTNLCCENGLDLADPPRLLDIGDLDPDRGNGFVESIDSAISALLGRNAAVLSLGGDHSVTYPIVSAYSRRYANLNVLQIDAHPDLYDQYNGRRFSHASPFARIMEQGRVGRLVQVGIRTANPHQREQARRWGVEMLEMQQWTAGDLPEFAGPLYLSIDLDAFDPAFAPGVSHPEPGGFDTRTVIRLIQRIRAPMVGADIVELNPCRDPAGTTAVLAAKLLKEVTAKMLERNSDGAGYPRWSK